jgi:hypothetical protein
MADQQKPDTNVGGENPAVPDPHQGTTHEADFGRTDRYATQDEDFNVRNLGDGTDWDNGGGASIGDANDARIADTETPGVKTRKADEEK